MRAPRPGNPSEDPTPFPRAKRVDGSTARLDVEGSLVLGFRTQRGEPLSGPSGGARRYAKKLRGRASGCGHLNKGAAAHVARRPIALQRKNTAEVPEAGGERSRLIGWPGARTAQLRRSSSGPIRVGSAARTTGVRSSVSVGGAHLPFNCFFRSLMSM